MLKTLDNNVGSSDMVQPVSSMDTTFYFGIIGYKPL